MSNENNNNNRSVRQGAKYCANCTHGPEFHFAIEGEGKTVCHGGDGVHKCTCPKYSEQVYEGHESHWADQGIYGAGTPETTFYENHPYAVQHKIKSALFTNGGSIHPGFYKDKAAGAGLYNWFRLMGSDIIDTREYVGGDIIKNKTDEGLAALKHIAEKYDVIFVNLSGMDFGMPIRIRQAIGQGSSTKLIVINDYSLEVLQNVMRKTKATVRNYILDLLCADLLLAQEPMEYNLFQHICKLQAGDIKEGRRYRGVANDLGVPNIALISHPVQTGTLKTLAEDVDKRVGVLGWMYHRFDGEFIAPSLLSRTLPKSWFDEMSPRSILYGYADDYNMTNTEDHLFDGIMLGTNWFQWISLYRSCFIAADFYSIHSHSRLASECACLKLPLCSTTHSYNATILYPECVAPYEDFGKYRANLERLITDENHWHKTVDFAYENVEEFNYQNSYAKLKEELDKLT